MAHLVFALGLGALPLHPHNCRSTTQSSADEGMCERRGVPLATTTETAESSAVDRCSIQRRMNRSRGRAGRQSAYPCVRGRTDAQRRHALASVLCRPMPASSHGHRTEPDAAQKGTGRTAFSCSRISCRPLVHRPTFSLHCSRGYPNAKFCKSWRIYRH